MSERPDYEVLARIADAADELSHGNMCTSGEAAMASLLAKLAGELAHWSASGA